MDNFLYFFIPLIILYLAFSNMNTLNRNKYLYGIDIDKNLIDKSILNKLHKEFKSIHTIVFLIILSIFIFYLNKFKSNLEAIFSIVLIAYLLFTSIIYIIFHNKVKNIKNNLIEEKIIKNNNDNKVFVDISFLNEREKLINKFKYLYFIPIITIFIVCIFTFVNKNSLSPFIPMKFDFNGNIIEKVPNTPFNLLMFLILMIGLNILLSFLSISSLKSRLKVDTNNIEKSKIENLRFVNKIGYGFLLIQISITLLFIVCVLSMFNININLLIFKTISWVLIIATILLTITYIKSPNLKNNNSYSSEDDENNWILGFIYNNPNDPSFMVPKRFGIGWTINIGTPLGKLFSIFTILLLSISLISLIKAIF